MPDKFSLRDIISPGNVSQEAEKLASFLQPLDSLLQAFYILMCDKKINEYGTIESGLVNRWID
jgi:hypothetical protein